MPMPKFHYGKSNFFKAVDRNFGPGKDLKTRLLAAKEVLETNGDIVAVMDEAVAEKHITLTEDNQKHFKKHWQTPSQGGGYAEAFNQIKTSTISEVLMEGYREAVDTALANKNDYDGGPLPISTCWVCHGKKTKFEVATVLNKGVNVMVIVNSPMPLSLDDHVGIKDDIKVTRRLEKDDLKAVKENLKDRGCKGNDCKVWKTKRGGKKEEAQDGDVGTFQVHT